MKQLLTILAITILGITANGQNLLQQNKMQPFVLGSVISIPSKQLSETRTLNIYVPDGYADNDTAKYPVIYLLDGSANEDYIHMVGLVQFLNMIEAMPQSIIVGVANVDRKRDFTIPTHNVEDKKKTPTSGGSEKFISFLEKELKPYIESNYKINGHSTIVGQSLGGLLASEILLKKPGMFTDYMIVSPSLWWDDESLLKQATTLMAKQDYKGHNIYIAVGAEGKQMEDDAKKLAELMKKTKAKTHFEFMPEETHLTMLHRSAYKGFEYLNGAKKL